MVLPIFQILRIDGLKSSERRSIVFLECKSRPELDAKAVFDGLDRKRQREVLSRFDLWIEGQEHNNKYFHGWDDREHRYCFVFKWKQKTRHHRLYGFLYHPQRRSRPRFELCVLASHATKNTYETDPRELDGMNALLAEPGVLAALQMTFPDTAPGEKKWKS